MPKKSYEFYARCVVPHFRRPNVNRAASLAWTFENTEDFNPRRSLGPAPTASVREIGPGLSSSLYRSNTLRDLQVADCISTMPSSF
jgi:hypothetical protein